MESCLSASLLLLICGTAFFADHVDASSKRSASLTDHFDDEGSAKSSYNYNVTYCSFDTDICGYTFQNSYGYSIQRRQTTLGPVHDRTTGTTAGPGFYIASVRVSSHYSLNNVATFKTPKLPPAGDYCLMFWYNTFGKSVKSLKVSTYGQHGIGYPVLTLTQVQDRYWHMAQVYFDSEYTSKGMAVAFQFETNAVGGYEVNAAIDDVYFFNAPCSGVRLIPLTHNTRKADHYTSYYTFHTTPMTWAKAASYCRELSPITFLVSIETAEEQAYLKSVIENDSTLSNAGKQGGFYTSGNDFDKEHDFRWSGELKYDANNVTYEAWRAGQPNNVEGDQDCLVLQYWQDQYKWGDRECSLELPFICETRDDTLRSELLRDGNHVTHFG